MEIACLDLEGVLVPEIWIEFAEKTGIDELKATTRDVPDYDVLMKQRLSILDQHRLGLNEIQETIHPSGFRSEPIYWDGTNSDGMPLAKGMYIYRLIVQSPLGTSREQSNKLIIIK